MLSLNRETLLSLKALLDLRRKQYLFLLCYHLRSIDDRLLERKTQMNTIRYLQPLGCINDSRILVGDLKGTVLVQNGIVVIFIFSEKEVCLVI